MPDPAPPDSSQRGAPPRDAPPEDPRQPRPVRINAAPASLGFASPGPTIPGSPTPGPATPGPTNLEPATPNSATPHPETPLPAATAPATRDQAIPAPRPDPALKGVALIALGFLIVTLSDAIVKWVLPQIGVGAAMTARGTFGAATVWLLAGSVSLLPVNRPLVAWRSVLHTAVTIGFYVAWFTGMPLGDTYAIVAITPLLMTALAIPLLGERVSPARWLLIALGLTGILLMIRPGGDLWRWEAAMLLAATGIMALTRIWTRTLARTDRPATIAFWLMFAHLPVGVALMITYPPASWPTPAAWLAIAALGASNGCAHLLFARAFALAPIGLLAPFEYSTLIFGTALGFAIWGDAPAWTTILGAAIVVAAGLLNLRAGRTEKGRDPARA